MELQKEEIHDHLLYANIDSIKTPIDDHDEQR